MYKHEGWSKPCLDLIGVEIGGLLKLIGSLATEINEAIMTNLPEHMMKPSSLVRQIMPLT